MIRSLCCISLNGRAADALAPQSGEDGRWRRRTEEEDDRGEWPDTLMQEKHVELRNVIIPTGRFSDTSPKKGDRVGLLGLQM